MISNYDDDSPLMVWAYCPDDSTKYNVQVHLANRCLHYTVISVSDVTYPSAEGMPRIHAMSVLDTAHVATADDALDKARQMMADVGGGTADLFDRVEL